MLVVGCNVKCMCFCLCIVLSALAVVPAFTCAATITTDFYGHTHDFRVIFVVFYFVKILISTAFLSCFFDLSKVYRWPRVLGIGMCGVDIVGYL